MSLSIKKFLNMRPQLPFRFSADITTDMTKWNNDLLNVSVKSVKVNLGESDLTKGVTYYGNGYFTIPIFNPAERSLEMSFTETDNMDVLKFFDKIQRKQFNYDGDDNKGTNKAVKPIEVYVKVTEYDESMTRELSKILYTCYLKEYTEPAFNRTGGVNIATIDATFIILDMKNELAIIKEKTETETENEETDTKINPANVETIKEQIIELLSDRERLADAMNGDVLDAAKLNLLIAETFDLEIQTGIYTAMEVEAAAKEIGALIVNNMNKKSSTPGEKSENPAPPAPAEPEQGQKAAEKQQEAKEEKKEEAKKSAPGEIVEGVDKNRLKAVLEKNESDKTYVYSNEVPYGDKDVGKLSKERKDEMMKNPGTRYDVGNGDKVWWNGKRFMHYDVATVGKGLTFRSALSDLDVTLTNEKGETKTMKGKDWNKLFNGKGRDKLFNGNGGDLGGTPTTSKWTIDKKHADDLYEKVIDNFIKTAKATAEQGGVNWDELSENEKILMVDVTWNRGSAKGAAQALKKVGSLEEYEDAKKFAKDLGYSPDSTLRRIDSIYQTQHSKQNKKKKKK